MDILIGIQRKEIGSLLDILLFNKTYYLKILLNETQRKVIVG